MSPFKEEIIQMESYFLYLLWQALYHRTPHGGDILWRNHTEKCVIYTGGYTLT